jgi:hypothetical protein
MVSAIEAGELWPAFFVQIGFISETIYIWSGLGTIVWNGNTYQGVGALLGISAVEEGATVEPRNIVITLSGLCSNDLLEVLGDYKTGMPVAVYLGLFSDATRSTLVNTPVCIWAGETDQPTVDVDDATATIAIACENCLSAMNVAVDRRRTMDDQQWQAPGDASMQFLGALQEKSTFWGSTPSSQNNI